MIDELSKFYSRKETISTSGITEPTEKQNDQRGEQTQPRDTVSLGSIFETSRFDLPSRRRSRSRSSSIL